MIQEIYNEFINECNNSEKAITEVTKISYSENDKLLLVREMTIKQAFVSVYTGWEHFLEKSMIAYTLGEANLSGFKPKRYILPTTTEHADQIIKGNATYPDWSDIKLVKEMAQRIFEDGKPYIIALNVFNSIYTEIKKTRNVIVHNSIKSKSEFDTLVRNALSASNVGLSPTDFLLSKKGNKPKFYKIYIEHLKNAASGICNHSQ